MVIPAKQLVDVINGDLNKRKCRELHIQKSEISIDYV